MRQFDQAAVQAFLRAAASSAEPRRELAAPDGSRLVLERDPAPGVTEQLTEVGPDGAARIHSRTYRAAPAPPAGYPPSAPFVPGRAVHVGNPGGEGNYMLAWEGVDDPAALVAELVRASKAEGWTEPEPAGGRFGRAAVGVVGAVLGGATGRSFAVRRLLRGGRQRLITAGGRDGRDGHVTLGEVPERSGAGAVQAVGPASAA